MSKSTNPLYHVSNDGRDVEHVNNIFELLIKKFGLTPVIDFLESMFQFMLDEVKSYPIFLLLKDMLDQIIEKMLSIYQRIGPFIAN
ncbi:hypothetical protein [Halobacteriovorax marinus]|uniref:hypothetical protein n=1 Tax=Halobacteriovorax marinus TaxID=97084 RepID=UPI003A8F9493